MGNYGLLLQSMGFMLLILILAYLAVRYGLKSVYRGINGGYMKVLERTPLDPKSGSSLLLVQIGKEVYLIGATQGGINLLKTFKWQDLEYAEDQSTEKQVNFKDSLNRVVSSFKKDSRQKDDQDGSSR